MQKRPRSTTNQRKNEEVAAKVAAAKAEKANFGERAQKRPKKKVVASASNNLSSWMAIKTQPFAARVLRKDLFEKEKAPQERRSEKNGGESIGLFGTVQTTESPKLQHLKGEPSLKDVPLTFSSTQEYAEIFLPLIVEEAVEEPRTNVASSKVSQFFIPWQMTLSETKPKQSRKAAGNQNKSKSFTLAMESAEALSAIESMQPLHLEESFPSNSSNQPQQQSTKLQRIELIVHTQICNSFQDLLTAENNFKFDRQRLVREAETKHIDQMKMRRSQCVCPSELGSGDYIMFASSKDFFSMRRKRGSPGNQKRTLETSSWVGLIQSGLQFIFRQRPSEENFGKSSYDIVAQLDVLFLESQIPPRSVYAWKLGGLITSWREYDALSQAVSTNGSAQQLLNVLLKGKDLETPASVFLPSGEVIQPGTEHESTGVEDALETPQERTSSSSDDTSSIVVEETVNEKSTEQLGDEPSLPVQPQWIPGMTSRLEEWLRSDFNPSQRRAILQTAVCTKGFTLIQGPPGTGKTHTLMGLLNMLHVSVFQRFYDSIVPFQDPTAPKLDSNQSSSSYQSQSKTRSDMMPHLLVTAPSNTAVDGMITKLLKTRFRDGAGNLYMPNIVRVGRARGSGNQDGRKKSSSVGNPTNRLEMVTIEYQVDELLNKLKGNNTQEIGSRVKWLEERETTIMRDMTGMKSQCRLCSQQIIEFDKVIASEGEQVSRNGNTMSEDELTLHKQDQELRVQQRQKALAVFHHNTSLYMQAHEKLAQTRLELSRCKIIGGGYSRPQIRAKLRESVLEQAHIVFVTLSSSALQQIVDLGSRFRFEVAVVDEAAQASEPSILVPLQHGVEHCVLVGDPRQLPATVLADTVQAHFYQQSLFERLQNAGHSSYLLDTQYRCHPLISGFPSKEFYSSQLKDGDIVTKPDYLLPIQNGVYGAFSPLTFYNVKGGRESKLNMSYRNEAEAELALNIYLTMRTKLQHIPGMERVGIGIITAYRDQLECLREKFQQKSLLQDPLLDLNTVDGYQGREFDVIIFSCVRAAPVNHEVVVGSSGSKRYSIGFLNDSRRLNVAITRAKYMLIVLGQEKALSSSKLWRKFLQYVKSKGRFLEISNPNVDLVSITSPSRHETESVEIREVVTVDVTK